MGDPARPQPFGAFLASVAAAGYDHFRGRPGVKVESAAFEEMRAYLLDLYADVDGLCAGPGRSEAARGPCRVAPADQLSSGICVDPV